MPASGGGKDLLSESRGEVAEVRYCVGFHAEPD
jgi:hypothetical protein